MLLIVLVGFLVTSSTFAEVVGSRYFRRGGSVDNARPYQAEQRYYTGGNYSGAHGNGQSQFQNQWNVNRQYQLSAEGRTVAGGQMGTSGEAQRGYIHYNQPHTLYDINVREAEIQALHRRYLESTQESYQTIAERRMENAQLAAQGTSRANDRQIMNQHMISINETLLRIEARQHREELQGTAKWLPPVRN